MPTIAAWSGRTITVPREPAGQIGPVVADRRLIGIRPGDTAVLPGDVGPDETAPMITGHAGAQRQPPDERHAASMLGERRIGGPVSGPQLTSA